MTQLQKTQSMLTWLEQCGAEGLENVRVQETSYGGLGVFMATETPAINPSPAPARSPPQRPIVLARVPARCCVTAEGALARDVGRAARNVLPECADEFVLCLDVAAGRRDAAHPQHPYLASLPAGGSQHAPTYPARLRRRLDGTELGAAAEKERAEVRAATKALLPRLRAARPDLFGDMAEADVLWAREMVVTRAFQSSLLGGEPGGCGVLAPLLDLRNHGADAAEAYGFSDAFAHFAQAPPLPRVGDELLTNYGKKTNLEHMMSHGFALRDDARDVFRLRLGDDAVFDLRAAGPRQFPRALWRALADDERAARGAAARAKDALRRPPRRWRRLGGAEAAATEILYKILGCCAVSARPFDAMAEDDARLANASLPSDAVDARDVFVARYRHGQRRILDDAVRVLEAACRIPLEARRGGARRWRLRRAQARRRFVKAG